MVELTQTRRAAEGISPYTAYVLFIVMLSALLSYLDRQVLTILLQPIKSEFGLSDTALGLLTGFAFATFYSTLCIPIAQLADRKSRSVIIAVSMAVWSLATVASGFSTSFLQLVVARIFVGIGEAGFLPAATSLVTDYVPTERRATALGITQAGISLGMMAGLLLGAFGVQLYGWRGAFLIAGLPGLIVAALFWLTVREPRASLPRRAAASSTSEVTLATAIAEIWRSRTYRYIIVGNCLSATVIYGLSSWFPTFLIRSFSLSPGAVGYLVGPVFGLAGALGLVVGGVLSDRLSERSPVRGLKLCASASVLAIPLIAVALHSASAYSAALVFGVAFFLGMIYAGPTISMICRVVPASRRALSIGLLLAAMNLLGLGFGPLFIGILADVLPVSQNTLQTGMLVEALLYVPAAFWYFLASRSAANEAAA